MTTTAARVSLTDEQQAVVALESGTFLLIAPPGCGKTLVLAERTMRLLAHSPGQRYRILALTFTRRAADEMRERIGQVVGTEGHRVHTSTFHAFCLDILQHYGESVGFRPGTTIYEREEDRLEALARGLEEAHLTYAGQVSNERLLRDILQELSRLKRALQDPSAVATDVVRGEIPLKEAAAAYDAVLRRHRACDYDDLLVLAHRLLKDNARIADHYRRVYRYILIDEAQDTSRAQYEALRALCGDVHRNVMLAGDDRQHIHGYAGATAECMRRFVDDFGATTVRLTRDFRLSRAVAQVVRRVSERLGHHAASATPIRHAAEGEAALRSFGQEADEAMDVVTAIHELLARGLPAGVVAPTETTRVLPEEIAVLARTRYLLQDVQDALHRTSTPYVTSFDNDLFETSLFDVIYRSLRTVHNPEDAIGVSRLGETLGEPSLRLGGRAPHAMLQELAASSRSAQLGGALRAIARLDAPVPASLDSVVDELLGLTSDACHAAAAEHDAIALDQDQRTLRRVWGSYRSRTDAEARSVGGLVAALVTAGRSALDEPGVRVLTVHAAKGLEFKVVFLLGLNEGSFPYYLAKSPADVQAERRAFYVALTRARRALYLSRARSRRSRFNAEHVTQPSSFLRDTGLEEERR